MLNVPAVMLLAVPRWQYPVYVRGTLYVRGAALVLTIDVQTAVQLRYAYFNLELINLISGNRHQNSHHQFHHFTGVKNKKKQKKAEFLIFLGFRFQYHTHQFHKITSFCCSFGSKVQIQPFISRNGLRLSFGFFSDLNMDARKEKSQAHFFYNWNYFIRTVVTVILMVIEV